MTAAEKVVYCLTYNHPGVMEAIQVEEDELKVKVLFRVFNEDAWLAIMSDLLSCIDRARNATKFVGKSYWLTRGELVYGWIVCLYATESADDFIRPLQEAFGIPSEPIAPRERQVGAPTAVPTAQPQAGDITEQVSERKPLQGRLIPQQRLLGKASIGFNPDTRKGAYPLESTKMKGVSPLHGGRG